jgi:hypothetical protein
MHNRAREIVVNDTIDLIVKILLIVQITCSGN